MKYMLNTATTMKEYNQMNYWIDKNIVPNLFIDAECVDDALDIYRDLVSNRWCIDISNNAIKHKSAMFIGDGVQCGYVITGSMLFQHDDYNWVKQYIDLWVAVYQINDVDF